MENLFAHLEDRGIAFDRETVIARCVELKKIAVEADEFDQGQRMLLNLGHTIGHGIEAQSHFEISHGTAVAMGTAIVTRAACKLGICTTETEQAVLEILTKFGLPISCNCTAETLYRYSLSDKKRSGGSVSLIIPERIGYCRIAPTPVEEIQSFIEAGL